MLIDNKVHIPITKAWIKDVLDVRIKKQGLKIDNLFVVTRAINETYEGEALIETEYGKLLVFWRNDLPEGKLAFILHTSKFNYPKKNQKLNFNGLIQPVELKPKEEYRVN